jgi:RNA 3'-terminal phosphate cyclase (ATP)
VGRHLADQLLIPVAMAGGGAYRTGPPSRHTLTNLAVVKQFLPVDIVCREFAPRAWVVEVAEARLIRPGEPPRPRPRLRAPARSS